MEVLHIGVNFYPEITGVGPLTTDLCRYLVDRGHSVTAVVATPHYPQWEVHPGYRNRLVARDEYEGVKLVRSYIYVPRKPSPLKRIAYDTTFTLSSLVASLVTRQRPDVVFAVCSPLQLGLSAYAVAALNRAPFVFHLQDLLPDGAVALGMLRNTLSVRLAYALGDITYARARFVSAIGEGFIDALVQRGVPPHKLRLIPNWVDTDWITPSACGIGFRHELGLADSDFVVMHVGNIGFKQGLETVVEAARALVDQQDIQFVVIGDGVHAGAVRELADAYGLPNFHMLGVQPKERLPEMLAGSDLLLLHQRAEVVDMVVPSKLLTYSASQRPILFAGASSSEGAKFVVRGKCGRVIAPGQPQAMARHIVELRHNEAERATLARNARAHVCENFSREQILERLESLLLEAAGV